MKSFHLATDEDRFRAHAFVSFKSDPDEALAEMVATLLRTDDLEVTLIHGDSVCPHAFGSVDAEKWIRKLLDTRVSEAKVLLSVASSASLQSDWVFQEFYLATQTCRIILLLWFSGSDPTHHFVPAPRFVTRRLPSCPVYLIDCRTECDQRMKDVSHILKSLRPMNQRLVLRKGLCALGLLAAIVAPIVVILYVVKPSDDHLGNAHLSSALVQGAEVWFLIVCTLAALFVPTALRLPEGLLDKGRMSLIVPGFGSQRYVLVMMFLLVLGAGLPMNVWGWLAIGIPSVIVVSIANRILRRYLILDSYKRKLANTCAEVLANPVVR